MDTGAVFQQGITFDFFGLGGPCSFLHNHFYPVPPFGFVHSQLLPFVEHAFPRETLAKELVV